MSPRPQNAAQGIKLILKPIPPDTVATVKEELLPRIEAVLKANGKQDLLTDGKLTIEVEKTFPIDQVVVATISGIAIKTFEIFVLPELKRWVEAKLKTRRKNKKRSKGQK